MILQRRSGDDWVWEITDRSANGTVTEAMRINGNTGAVTTASGVSLVKFSEQAAYTQTYSTATKTVAAATTHAITDSSGGAASTSALAAITEVAHAGSADVGPVKDNFATLAAEQALAEADLLALKKVFNAIIDDLQAVGISG